MIYALLLCTSQGCTFPGLIFSYNPCPQFVRTGLEKGTRPVCVRVGYGPAPDAHNHTDPH